MKPAALLELPRYCEENVEEAQDGEISAPQTAKPAERIETSLRKFPPQRVPSEELSRRLVFG